MYLGPHGRQRPHAKAFLFSILCSSTTKHNKSKFFISTELKAKQVGSSPIGLGSFSTSRGKVAVALLVVGRYPVPEGGGGVGGLGGMDPGLFAQSGQYGGG